ncbi:MAG TPA: DUF2752 domain-containing protein [Polyangiaceae bacterium]|nr:DUF2752 domain-containing protein [Polyangiaceae bacterium]
MDRAIIRRSLLVLTLAAIFSGIVAFRLPFCPLASVVGVPCPGCGLTRATLALARGDLKHALELHPLVLVLAPLFIGAVGSAAYRYVRGPGRDRSLRPWLASRTVSALGAALLLATLGVWIARFFGHFGGPVPVETLSNWSRAHWESSAELSQRPSK